MISYDEFIDKAGPEISEKYKINLELLRTASDIRHIKKTPKESYVSWITEGFPWIKSNEGQEYWSEIRHKFEGSLQNVTTGLLFNVTWYPHENPDENELGSVSVIFREQPMVDVIKLINKHDYSKLEIETYTLRVKVK